jgi:hypothetical protein
VDRRLARQYRDRWQAVADFEAHERRKESMELRWRQLNAIYRMGLGMGLVGAGEDESEREVWRRWALLKRGKA